MDNEQNLPVRYQGYTKVIHIIDPQSGMIRETEYEHGTGADKAAERATMQGVMESLGVGKYASLKEAATTSEFPVLLRSGLKQILFNSYNEEPETYSQWVKPEPSDKEAEDWVEMNRMGTLPVVPQGTPYPDVDVALDRTIRVANYKRGMKFGITEEMWRFDKSNQMRQFPQELGAAAKQTIEEQCYAVINTTANYTRNSTTGDNDVGANTLTSTFSAVNLNTALGTLQTMKDRKSGRYLNINPDTLIVAPRLALAAKQLLLAPNVVIPGSGDSTAKVYGTGSVNPFRGLINQIIVSPYFGNSFQWCLLKAFKAAVYQEVEPLQLTLAGPMDASNEGWFQRDVINYRVRVWFGAGLVNDRYAFLSDSTTAPVIG